MRALPRRVHLPLLAGRTPRGLIRTSQMVATNFFCFVEDYSRPTADNRVNGAPDSNDRC
jgi:hypothetical protein